MTEPKAEIKGTDITPQQLASASQFLTALGWKEEEAVRAAKRSDVVLLIAWYGALRYQAAIHHIGSCEDPGPLRETTPRREHLKEMPEFEIVMDIADVTTRSL